jgi:hypothetical protein
LSGLRPGGLLRALARRWAERRYAILFYSLLLALAAAPLLDALRLDARGLQLALGLSLLLGALGIAPGRGRKLLVAATLGVLAVRAAPGWLVGSTLPTASLALWTLLALVTAAVAVRFALRATRVDAEHLYAALSAYLLAGLFLGVLYWAMESLQPGSFAAGDPADAWSLASAIYFSFVTLATLGYGDWLPRTELARGLAIVETVAGQFYLAVMIANLASTYVRSGRDAKD